MSWTFKLVTAPQAEFDSANPGLVNRRTMWGNKFGFDESMEILLGPDAPFIPEVGAVRDRSLVSSRLRGPARVARPLNSLKRIRIQVEAWTGVEWAVLDKIMATQRLVAFHPVWDKWTWWASSFGNPENDQGLAEVGDTPVSGYVKRARRESVPSRWGTGALVEETTNQVPGVVKLVPGLIGHAILLESGGQNYANTAQHWGTPTGPGEQENASDGPASSITSDYLRIPAGEKSVFPATSSRPSGDYAGSCWVRGQGTVFLQAFTGVGTFTGDEVVLTDEWQFIEVSWTQGSPSIVAAEIVEHTTTDEAMVHVSAPQVEDGLFPTSIMQAGIGLKNADELKITDSLNSGAGLTFLFWYKTGHATHLQDIFFLSWEDGGADRYIRKNGVNYQTNIGGTSVTGISSIGNNVWTQLAVVFRMLPATGPAVQVYENGKLKSTGIQTALTFPVADAGLYVGSDRGLGTPANLGLNLPLDSVRIDSRAWSTQELLDDYEMRTDAGVAAFLAHTAGRLFRVGSVPKGFRGPFTDQVIGDLVLEEVSHIPAGLVA